MTRRPSAALASFALSLSLAGLGGCGLVQGPAAGAGATATVSQVSAVKATGIVHGGQQPISGATIQLWTVGTTGYGSAGTALISATLTTSDGTGLFNSNANVGNNDNALPAGYFSITGDYTCPTASTLVYLVATGGNPGLTAGTNNSAIVLMAPLGQCGSLTPSTFISINEVTTVAATYALAQFMTYTGVVGAPGTGATSIASAFAEVNNLVSIASGTALATDSLGNTVPQSTINTFANTVVPCVNSTGPTSTACSTFFGDVYSGLSPLTVLSALLDLALFPNANTTTLFGLSTANTAFQPSLSSAPHNWTLTLGGAAQSYCGYSGSGYTVSGAVNYSGTKTGQIYLALVNNSGCGGGTQGVSISAKGGYSIRGVPPGTYTLYAFMDISTLGYGQQNAADPSGSTATITVGSSNVGSQNVTLVDPSTVTVTSAPSFKSISPYSGGVVVQDNPIKSNGVEVPVSYTLQWSTTSSFTAIAGSQTFPANGTHQNAWFVNGLTNGSVYYFRAYGTSAGTAVGPYSTVSSAITIGAPSTGSSVSGAVTYTGAATGPMYVGLLNQYTEVVYLEYIANPASSQAYTVVVPNSATAVYQTVAIIDQNNDGIIDAGDITNVDNSNGGGGISVTAPIANENFTLPTGNSTATVTTESYLTGTYNFNLQVNAGTKLPVAVTLESSSNSDGANVTGLMDIALCGQTGTSCGQGFQIGFNLGTTVPSVGDTYFFNVTYSDGTTGTITAAVTGVLTSFATSLAPTTGTSVSTTPTFTWTAPVCGLCSTYIYDFYINPANGNQGQIWEVPGDANGLPYTTTSLVWGVDPTDSGNTPSVSSLTLGTNYSWAIQVIDTYGNVAETQASYTP